MDKTVIQLRILELPTFSNMWWLILWRGVLLKEWVKNKSTSSLSKSKKQQNRSYVRKEFYRAELFNWSISSLAYPQNTFLGWITNAALDMNSKCLKKYKQITSWDLLHCSSASLRPSLSWSISSNFSSLKNNEKGNTCISSGRSI